jgi:hypothetical protein
VALLKNNFSAGVDVFYKLFGKTERQREQPENAGGLHAWERVHVVAVQVCTRMGVEPVREQVFWAHALRR